jgi:hypothetical protein
MSTQVTVEYPLVPRDQVYAQKNRGSTLAKAILGHTAWWRRVDAEPEKVICVRDQKTLELSFTIYSIYEEHKREVTVELRRKFSTLRPVGMSWRELRMERRRSTFLV